MLYLIQLLYYAIPVAAIIFFVTSLVRYISAKKRNKRQPGSVSARKMSILGWTLVVASVIMGVFLIVIIAFCALMFMAVAFM